MTGSELGDGHRSFNPPVGRAVPGWHRGLDDSGADKDSPVLSAGAILRERLLVRGEDRSAASDRGEAAGRRLVVRAVTAGEWLALETRRPQAPSQISPSRIQGPARGSVCTNYSRTSKWCENGRFRGRLAARLEPFIRPGVI